MPRAHELVEQLRTGPWVERSPSEFILEAAKDVFDTMNCGITIHEEPLVVKVRMTRKTINRYHWRDTIYTFTPLSCCITGTNFKSPHLCSIDEGFSNLLNTIEKHQRDMNKYKPPE